MKQYFTFGQTHVHPETGEPMKDYWIEVNDKDSGEARKLMFAAYGEKWGFQYDETNFNPKYFPKGCYETLGGNNDLVFSLKPITGKEFTDMLLNKLRSEQGSTSE